MSNCNPYRGSFPPSSQDDRWRKLEEILQSLRNGVDPSFILGQIITHRQSSPPESSYRPRYWVPTPDRWPDPLPCRWNESSAGAPSSSIPVHRDETSLMNLVKKGETIQMRSAGGNLVTAMPGFPSIEIERTDR